MRTVTGSMGQVVKGMDKAMESMNLEKVSWLGCVAGHRLQTGRRGVGGRSAPACRLDGAHGRIPRRCEMNLVGGILTSELGGATDMAPSRDRANAFLASFNASCPS